MPRRPPKNATDHGSENRQKPLIVGFRVSQEEKTEIELAAERAGLTVGSYVREKILLTCITRKCHRPTIDRVLLSKTLAQLGKVGANLNQAVKLGHEGNVRGIEKVVSFLEELKLLKESILEALRRKDDNQG
jgi:hypothetical protein